MMLSSQRTRVSTSNALIAKPYSTQPKRVRRGAGALNSLPEKERIIAERNFRTIASKPNQLAYLRRVRSTRGRGRVVVVGG